MTLDDRFEGLVASLGGFYRTWFIYAGLELGLFARLRRAGEAGMAIDDLAAATGTQPELIARWAWGAEAHDLIESDGTLLRVPEDVALILLDADRSAYLGGQFIHAATASLDYDGLLEVFRTGRPLSDRPDRYRSSIERLTVQDIAVFFQEALASLPQLVLDLRPGTRIVDIHCGGGRWLIAMARRFPGTTLVGVEFEADSVERARANIAAAGLTDRIAIEHRELTEVGHLGEFDLAYFQYALHLLADPPAAIRSAWAAVRRGGWLVSQEWYLPTDPDEMRSRHGELIAGVQLDEAMQGTRLVHRAEALAWFTDAGVPDPALIDLPAGASLIVARA